MHTLTLSRPKVLPKLVIDPSMDYRSSSSSGCSYSSPSNKSSSMVSYASNEDILVRAIYDFDSSESEQLSLRCGEVLEVIYMDNSGWCAAHREDDKSVGWIPTSYVEPLSQTSLEDPDGYRDIWSATVTDTCCVLHSGLLSHYHNQLSALSPDSLDSPGRTGTRSKAISLGAQVTPEPEPNTTQQSFLFSAHPAVDHTLCNIPASVQSPLMSEDQSPAQEIIWNPNELLKLCPSSPSAPPPPPPTPGAVLIGEASTHLEAVGPGSISAEEACPLSSDAYSVCHPRCAHRRLVRMEDGLYFRPLSVLLETQSIYSEPEDGTQDDELDSPDEHPSFGSSSRRADKIKQITGDEIAQAVHAAKIAHVLLPRYLRPTHGQELRLDHDGSVIAGTLRALVENLASEPFHPSIERHFRHAFFSTLRTMGTPDELFDQLLDQYHQEQPDSLTGVEADDWRIKRLFPAQRRVLSVFETWLVHHRMVEDDPPVAQRLQTWLNSLVEASENIALASELLKTLERLTFAVPSRPSPASKHSKRRKTRDSKHELLRVDPSLLAENLCLYESRLFSKVAPREFLEWINTRLGDPVANLLTFCNMHDKLGAWVKHSILLTNNLAHRADVVDLWVKVAERCREMHNFSSMSAIV
ncbi:uncharacterized protein PHACADRAFT_112102, partial [Phanerochaete carnosa HHB-10118-sp]